MLIQDITIKKILNKAKLLNGTISDYGWYINDIIEVINYYISIGVIFLSLDVFDENHDLGSILTLKREEHETEESFRNRGYKEIINHIKEYYSNDKTDRKYLFYPFFTINKNISKYYNIGKDGLILYGPYTSYSIYIEQDTDTKEYIIYLWKKDSNEDGLEFRIKNKEELQKFFDDNDILVEWEENENS